MQDCPVKPWRFIRLGSRLIPDPYTGTLRAKMVAELAYFDQIIMIEVAPDAQLSLIDTPEWSWLVWKTNRHGDRFCKTVAEEVRFLNKRYSRPLSSPLA